ncbi:MAG: N-acetyltransferase [Pseudomonadota bacterium]
MPSLCDIHDAARYDELVLSAGTSAYLTLAQTFDNEGLFDGHVDVAELDGHVCGFIAYTPVEITWLYVAREYYRCGIGRRQLNHALGQCDTQVTLEVLEGNEPALALYLSVGFKVVKRMQGQLAGNEAFAAVGLKLLYKRQAGCT